MKQYKDVLFAKKIGNGKTVWLKCGMFLQKDNGKWSIKLDAIPVGFDGWLAIGEDVRTESQAMPNYMQPGDHDEMPFQEDFMCTGCWIRTGKGLKDEHDDGFDTQEERLEYQLEQAEYRADLVDKMEAKLREKK